MVKKYIDAGIEVARFLKSLKNLVDKGFVKNIDQAKAFAKQEFGEVSDLMTLQINKIFKTKNQPVVGKKTKDPVFDNTVEELPYDDAGVPFNPKNPQKVYGKPRKDIKKETSDLDDILEGLEADKSLPEIDENLLKNFNDEIKAGVDEIMSDTSPAALKKIIEVDNLMLEYEGLSKDFAKQIANEINPRKKADMIAMVKQTIKMSEEGKSGSEIIDIFKGGKTGDETYGVDAKMKTKVDNFMEADDARLEAMTDAFVKKQQVGFNVEKFIEDFPVSREEAVRISKLPQKERAVILQKYIDNDMKQQIELMDFEPPKDRDPNAMGGRIGYGTGTPSKNRFTQLMLLKEEALDKGDMDKVRQIQSDIDKEFGKANGGRIGYADGTENMMAEIDYSSSAYRFKLIDSLMDTGGLDYGSAVKEADRIIEIKLRPKTKKKLAAGGLPNILGY